MSVRFAPACNPARLTGWYAQARGLVHLAQVSAANDNGDDALPKATFDPLLTDALHHFATHGLGAVKAALDEAEHARAAGDTEANAHWLAITGMFDRRRAAAAIGKTASA
ncbi:MAG: hypothetical protein CVT76_03120 [Alphaproteobacteria bacterium HGW-Alphaproteobacteria-15]|nr:MAG: hypothetical protein CVT76_03120 [Alphaproteobacteria bacterium HGW-Alphaproteobacteria-15]